MPNGILHDQLGELHRILYAYTPMTERTHLALKQFTRGRIMQVNVIAVGKNKLDAAKRVVRTWRLHEGKWEGASRVISEVDRSGVARTTRRVDKTHVHTRQVPAIPPHKLKDFVYDAGRNRPGRIELNVLDRGRENRRPRVTLTDDGAGFEYDVLASQQVHLGAGDIHDHERIRQITRDPAGP